MTLPLRFFIPGPVVAKMRARHAQRGAHVVTYTPDKQATYEAWVRGCAIVAWGEGRPPLDEPLDVSIVVGVSIPASWSKKKQAAALAGDIRPTGKPDLDNAVKSIFDALNGVIWRDDAVICRQSSAKAYSQVPGAHVSVARVVHA